MNKFRLTQFEYKVQNLIYLLLIMKNLNVFFLSLFYM